MWSYKKFWSFLAKKTTKAVLGNIYTSEAIFHSAQAFCELSHFLKKNDSNATWHNYFPQNEEKSTKLHPVTQLCHVPNWHQDVNDH